MYGFVCIGRESLRTKLANADSIYVENEERAFQLQLMHAHFRAFIFNMQDHLVQQFSDIHFVCRLAPNNVFFSRIPEVWPQTGSDFTERFDKSRWCGTTDEFCRGFLYMYYYVLQYQIPNQFGTKFRAPNPRGGAQPIDRMDIVHTVLVIEHFVFWRNVDKDHGIIITSSIFQNRIPN